MTTKGASPLRADARRNRARVLDAAEAIFAAKGTAASTEEIAREAGVGIGTVFRHFASKEALLAAILVGRTEQLIEEAQGLAGSEDAGAAFFSFFTRMIEQAEKKKVFVDALAEAGVDVKKVVSPIGKRARRAVGTLLSRAQEAGAVRADVGISDVMALLVGVARAAEHSGWDRRVKARALAVVFDGLGRRTGIVGRQKHH